MGAEREPSLDGLRAVAALSVVAAHAHVPFIAGGLRGVDVFFVLSGYLITSLLRDEIAADGRISYSDFMRRRLLRLYPALGLLLCAFVAVAPASVRLEAIPAALYVSNVTIAADHGPRLLAHTWSLALEMQFYLAWPLVLPVVLRMRRPILWLGLAYLAATAARAVLPPDVAYYFRPSGLVLGALVALARQPLAGWVAYPAALLLALSLTISPYAGTMVWGIATPELATAALISSLAEGSRVKNALSARPMVGLGLISYGIYLWHFPIAYVLVNRVAWPTTALVSASLAIALAALSYVTVERWVRLAVRRRPIPA